MTTETPPVHSRETDRFYDCFKHFGLVAGCCLMCAIDFSIAVVEKEEGRTWKTAECPAGPERQCRERARGAWSSLPKKRGDSADAVQQSGGDH